MTQDTTDQPDPPFLFKPLSKHLHLCVFRSLREKPDDETSKVDPGRLLKSGCP